MGQALILRINQLRHGGDVLPFEGPSEDVDEQFAEFAEGDLDEPDDEG